MDENERWDKFSQRKDEWLRRDLLGLQEAVIILLGGAAVLRKDRDGGGENDYVLTAPWSERHDQILDMAVGSIKAGILPMIGDHKSYARLGQPNEWRGDVLASDFIVWAISKGFEVPEEWSVHHPRKQEKKHLAENTEEQGSPQQRRPQVAENPAPNTMEYQTDNSIGTRNQRQETNPGELLVIVDDINESITVVSQRGQGQKTVYSRWDILGKGTVTWPLLVDFAKHKGNLEGNHSKDVKERNTPANRRNLNKKLIEKLGLSESPIIAKRKGVMCFRSIHLKGSTAPTDAMDRQTISYRETIASKKQSAELEEQGTEFLANYGEDMPPLD